MNLPNPTLVEPQVIALCEKYRYEEPHCLRVANLAQTLFEQLAPLHKLEADAAVVLRHAALLHDIGHYIHYRGHHRHSAYLIRHDASLAAGTPEYRETLALIARNHRKRPREAPDRDFSTAQARAIRHLSAILRLADGLDHDRAGTASVVRCEITDESIRMAVSGVELGALAGVLADKGSLAKKAWGRSLIWAEAGPAEIAEAQGGA